VPLAGLLELVKLLIPVHALGLSNTLEHVKNTRHHTLETAEVHVGTLVKQHAEHLIRVLLHLVLNIHLSTLLVILLTGDGIVKLEVVGMRLEHCLPLIIVKEVVGVGHTKEQPGSALEVTAVRGVLGEQAAKERTVRGDTGTGGNHNDGGLRVGLRQKHDLAGRTSHLHLIPRLSIAQVVGAHTLLGGVLRFQLRAPVGGTANAEGHGVAGHVISISGRSDGVKSNRVGLAILGVQAGRQNTVRLALPIRHLAEVIDDDVASLTRGVLTNNSLAGDDLANMRLLVLVGVEGDARHVKVGVSLKEVLGLSDCRSEGLAVYLER